MPDKTRSVWHYGVSAAAALAFTGALLAQDVPDEEFSDQEMSIQAMPQPAPLPNPVPPLPNPVPPLSNPVPPLSNPVPPLTNPVPPLINPVPPIVNPVPPLPNPISSVPTTVP